MDETSHKLEIVAQARENLKNLLTYNLHKRKEESEGRRCRRVEDDEEKGRGQWRKRR